MKRRLCIIAASAVSALLAFTRPATAGGFGVVDIGAGTLKSEPYIVGSTDCTSIALGYVLRTPAPLLRGVMEMRWSAGTDGGTRIPEDARAGTQTLWTLTAGGELNSSRAGRGAFLDAGLGVGRSTISDAYPPLDAPPVPFHLADRTAAAYSLGLGVRLSFRPGWLPHQVELRRHGLLRSLSRASAQARAVTLGFTF